MSSTRYDLACLTGHGIGPEVMAQAYRVVDAASHLHGFSVDEVHVPFAAEALMRFGHPFPPSSRRVVLGADAVLAPLRDTDVLDMLEPELDLCAAITRIRSDEGVEVSVLSPLRDDAWEWTLRRAFGLARDSRARVALVAVDGPWAEAADGVQALHDGLEVERLTLHDAVHALVFASAHFDVVVTPPEYRTSLAEVTACLSPGRVAAWGRLAPNGPGVFGPAHGAAHDIAGQDAADPRPMLLAASLMLGEGLGERPAAATVASAVSRASTQGDQSTRAVGDGVLAELPLALTNAEFYPEFAA